jgi:hypothetical protein
MGEGTPKKLRAGTGAGADWNDEDRMTAMGMIAGRC